MIKKVRTEELKLGMFIHDLNAGWMDHAFFRTRFMLRREEDLKKIQESGIRELYIDTLRGLDAADAPTEDEVRHDLEARMRDAVQAAHPLPERTTHREELAVARQIQAEATRVVQDMLGDVRLGRQVQVDRMNPVVTGIADSVLRNQGTLVSLLRIKERDTYTFQHCVSVATLLISFGHALELDAETIRQAGIGGMVHDVGKMRVPDHILNKPGKLTDAEFEVMKGHVSLGMEVLEHTPGMTPTILAVSGEHHERFNGTGYPRNLRGREISQLGRMAAIVDVYDAITSNRVYHKGMEPAEALQKLFEWSEHHLDPELVQRFIQSLGIYPVGSLVRLESQRLGIVVQQGKKGLLYPVVRLVYDIKRGSRILPRDLDLGAPESGGDHVIAAEQPEDWKINPLKVLTLELPK
jgi:putative nucleotidyltransferase with HDIG domain